MKIKILSKNNKKNFLKENCGVPAEIGGATEFMPMGDADITSLSPEAAFDAGFAAAINEINAIISEMVPGGDPIEAEIEIPVAIDNIDQLEEDGECPESGCVHKDDSVSGKWEIESNKTGKDWKAKYKSKKDAKAALRAYHASK
jgi:hypothetical protein